MDCVTNTLQSRAGATEFAVERGFCDEFDLVPVARASQHVGLGVHAMPGQDFTVTRASRRGKPAKTKGEPLRPPFLKHPFGSSLDYIEALQLRFRAGLQALAIV
jgi:hypothetical protein